MFLVAITIARVVAAASSADVQESERVEARAFELADAHDDCGAATAFLEAYRAAAHVDLLRDAAISAERAHDLPFARDLWSELASLKSARQQEALDRAQAAMKTLASLPATTSHANVCARPADRPGTLEERVALLEQKMRALEEKKGATVAGAGQTAPDFVAADDSPTLGDAKTPITFVAFLDFECPFCAASFPLLQDAVHDPDLKKQVHVVFKHFPLSFHKNAMAAAKASLAARAQGGDDKFWQFAAAAFASRDDLSQASLEHIARTIGLDVVRFDTDLSVHDADYAATIARDAKEGTAIGVRGTPTYLVGGWTLDRRSVDGIKETIRTHDLGAPASATSSAKANELKRVRTQPTATTTR